MVVEDRIFLHLAWRQKKKAVRERSKIAVVGAPALANQFRLVSTKTKFCHRGRTILIALFSSNVSSKKIFGKNK